jgi:hypothetical protein
MEVKMKTVAALFMILFISSIAFSQDNGLDDRDPVAMIKASIIFQFAYQSEWPKIENRSSDFLIGVYHNDVIYDQLVLKYATQPIGDQVLKIEQIHNLEDCSTVQIVFVDKSKKAELKQISQLIGNQSVMLISDCEKATNEGATVGFVVEDAKTKFEINEKEVKKKRISIGTMLREWAVK